MTVSSVDGILNSFKGKKVLVLGDVMVDTYIYGSVSRISPEAPVPIMNVSSKENRLGGAANVALNIQALGGIPLLCSIVGDDLPADYFYNLLEDRGLSTDGIIRSRNRMTTVKNRLISGSHHLIRIDEEHDIPLNNIDQKSLESHIFNLLDEADLIIFEDYDKGCLNNHVIKFCIDEARKKDKLTAVDPKSRNFGDYGNCTIFKPNLKEMNEGMRISLDLDDIEGVIKAADQLKDDMHCDNVMVTLSGNGIVYSSQNGSGHSEAHRRSISDVSGAGDTVISVAALAIHNGFSMEAASALANLAGGLVCEYPGVVPVVVEDLRKEIEKDPKFNELLG